MIHATKKDRENARNHDITHYKLKFTSYKQGWKKYRTMGPFGPRKFLVFQKMFVIDTRQADKHIGTQTYRKFCMDSGMLLSFNTHFPNLFNALMLSVV